ncbi:STAS domain-containing protein [Streptomyces microflavus]|uniref:STAS domain-containing protein n=1 Tax=Streptomyces microflavus TaxID=1919 RepID=UPI00365FA1C9
MTAPTLSIHISTLPAGTLVAVGGEIDLHTAPQLQDAVDAAQHGPDRPLHLDMTDVSFCDCSGLNVLLRARTRGPVRIQGAQPILLHVLTLTGTRDMFLSPPSAQSELPARPRQRTHAESRRPEPAS